MRSWRVITPLFAAMSRQRLPVIRQHVVPITIPFRAAHRGCAGNASFWFTGPAGSRKEAGSGGLVKSATVYSPAPT
ncbi:MAG: hypothetical protein WCB27_11045 [Thermoguttaceae bacterium]